MSISVALIYPAFLATAVSVIGLTWLAKSLYDPHHPRTLSEMAAMSPRSLLIFRCILYPCAVLFGISCVVFIAPLSRFSMLIAGAALAMCSSEIILAAVPARGQWQNRIHNFFGYLMGASMFALAVVFTATLSGLSQILLKLALLGMAALFVATLSDRKHFIWYELPYIYLSHLTILIAASYFALMQG